MKFLTGPLMNLIGGGKPYGATPLGPVILEGASADPSYPLVKAYDGQPASPFRTTAAVTGMCISFANNLVKNGDFEQGTVGWTAAGATLTSESGAGNFYKGAKSAKVVNSAAPGLIQADYVTVQAGQWIQIWAAAKSDGTNTICLVLTCLETGNSILPSGLWGTGGQAAMSKTGATMTAFTPITFQVPAYSELGKSTATLRIALVGLSNPCTYYWDEVLLVPAIDFMGIFGHGFDASTALALVGSTADYWYSGTWGSQLIGGPVPGSCLTRQATIGFVSTRVYDPFPRLVFYPGQLWNLIPTTKVPWIGEAVVGQTIELSQTPDYPLAIEYKEPNVRFATSGGSQWVLPRGGQALRRATLSFAYLTDADYIQARDVLYGMSRGGAYPVILIPTETDPGEGLYGRLEDSTTFRREGFTKRVAEFIVQEEAFPWF